MVTDSYEITSGLMPTIDNTTLLSPPSSDLSRENDVHTNGFLLRQDSTPNGARLTTVMIYHLPTIDNTTLLSPPSSDLSIENDVYPNGFLLNLNSTPTGL